MKKASWLLLQVYNCEWVYVWGWRDVWMCVLPYLGCRTQKAVPRHSIS